MFTKNFYILLGIVCCLQQFTVKAYPTINIRRLFDTAIERYKKNEANLPQLDEDVLELEHLKQDEPTTSESAEEGDIHFDISSPMQPVPHSSMSGQRIIQPTELLPALEQQLEEATTSKPTAINNIGQREEEELVGIHRPPMLPQHDGGKINQKQEDTVNQPHAAGESNASPPILSKPFYGAARLAFGQNPEVLPSTSTTTTAASTATTTTATPLTTNGNIPESIMTSPPTAQLNEGSIIASQSELNQEEMNLQKILSSPGQGSYPTFIPHQLKNEEESPVEAAISQADVAKSGPERRSVTMMSPKTAEDLLKHSNGQYSSFDMAQYIFWTGDEEGVAKAVKEFIDRGLMSRESAIKFLRDIRLGIEYLQNSYVSRGFADQLRDGYIKKHSHNIRTQPIVTTTSTTARPLHLSGERERPIHFEEHPIGQDILKQHLEKSFESVPSLLRLQNIDNGQDRENLEYDELAGRAKIAKFLYTEFSLEEVIYQLGKVMFTQSLAHGSNQAQQALQRLTDFLEVEGKQGLISPELQKKVLDVLLSALSDTLVEHPELLVAARENLGSSFEKVPVTNNAIKSKQN